MVWHEHFIFQGSGNLRSCLFEQFSHIFATFYRKCWHWTALRLSTCQSHTNIWISNAVSANG